MQSSLAMWHGSLGLLSEPVKPNSYTFCHTMKSYSIGVLPVSLFGSSCKATSSLEADVSLFLV
jgi:hypothetical protein